MGRQAKVSNEQLVAAHRRYWSEAWMRPSHVAEELGVSTPTITERWRVMGLKLKPRGYGRGGGKAAIRTRGLKLRQAHSAVIYEDETVHVAFGRDEDEAELKAKVWAEQRGLTW